MRPGARSLLILLAFLLLAAPLAGVGAPRTPARDAIFALRETPTIAILGDSRPHYGLSPSILTATFAARGSPGMTAYSFAEDGTDMLHHHDLFATALLRRSPPPKIVILATNPLSFDETRKNNRLDRLDPAELPAFARAGAPLETLLDVGTMAVFPPYHRRPRIKEGVELFAEKAAYALMSRQRHIGLHIPARPERRAYIPHPDGHEPFIVFRDWQLGFDLSRSGYRERYQSFVLGDFHLGLLRDMARLARESRVLLVILEMPVAPAYRAELASRGAHRAWRERVAAIAAEEGAVWLCHADLYDDDHWFGDPGHMQQPLSARYSEALALALLDDPKITAALRGAR